MANNPTTPQEARCKKPADSTTEETDDADPTRICWTQLLRSDPDDEQLSPSDNLEKSGPLD